MTADYLRPVFSAHASTSGQFQAGRPPTVQEGSGRTLRSRHMSTVCRLTDSRSAISGMPTGSQVAMPITVEKDLTTVQGCRDTIYMAQTLNGNQIQPGDTVTFESGKTVQIVSVRPYDGTQTMIELLGEGTQLATVWQNGSQVEMSFPAVSRFLVERAA